MDNWQTSYILTTIFGLQYRYTFVFGGKYTNVESIKSGERARTGAIQMTEIMNIASVTPLPIQRTKMLSNPKNKSNIADFLLNYWIGICEEQPLPGYEIYFSGGFHDINRAVKVTPGHHIDIPQPGCDHEEADSRMFLLCGVSIQM